MKKSTLLGMVSLQVIMFFALIIIGTQVYTTEKLVMDTQSNLTSTIAVMDGMQAERQAEKEWNTPLAMGTKASSFSLHDENSQEVNLNDYKGKKTLLVFTQPGCTNCEAFYPVLNQFQEQEEKVNVLVLQLNSTPTLNKQHKESYSIQSKVLAASNSLADQYKIRTTPTSVVIDEEGNLAGVGEFTQLEQLVSMVNTPAK